MKKLLLALGLLTLPMGCLPFDSTFCAPCESNACELGLECLEGVCVLPDRPEACDNYVAPPRCGEHPPCAEGFECLEGACRTPIDIAAGREHACALWPSGRVSCWGSNRHGEAGQEFGRILTEAHSVEGITNAVELSLGQFYSCARTEEGEVYCWGHDNFGQLGNGTHPRTLEQYQSTHAPQRVQLNAPARLIAAGLEFGCAVTIHDELFCWGSRALGCVLGDETTPRSSIPLLIATEVRFEEMVAAGGHVLGVVDGQLFGFGSNANGALGPNAPINVCAPVELGVLGVRGISARRRHSCVLTGERTVRCFGEIEANQRVDKTFDFPAPVRAVRSGVWNACAQLEGGGLVCWGRGSEGLLGDPSELPSALTSTTVIAINDSEQADAFTVGNAFGCLIREKGPRAGTYCWGNGSVGRLGNGVEHIKRAERVYEGEALQALNSGTHNCARDAQGRVLCWGQNQFGQLGLSYRSNAEPPKLIPDLRAVQLAVGQNHSCALTAAGEVYCWGAIGLRTCPSKEPILNTPTPQKISGLPPMRTLASGNFSICGVSVAGEGYCFGCNAFELVQEGAGDGALGPHRNQRLDGAIALSGARLRYCALHPGDEVRCFGNLQEIPERMTVTGAKSLTVGERFLLVLREDGRLEGGGVNNHGQLGTGNFRSPLTNALVYDISDAVQVDSIWEHGCALRANGEVRCWGYDLENGRLGQGPTGDRPTPASVPGLPPAAELSVNTTGGCTISADRKEIWCWGTNNLGAVDGVTPEEPTPIPVRRLRGRGRTD